MKERLVLKKSVKKTLLTIILLLVTLILTKSNDGLKEYIKREVYEKSISFMNTRNLYNKYFSSTEKNTIKPVITEKITKKKEEKTKEGVKLTVSKNTAIPLLESGIIIMIDSNKIVIEQVDGVTAYYDNIITNNYKMYDYLEKGDILGEAKEEEIYISFIKEGEYYDYQKYI